MYDINLTEAARILGIPGRESYVKLLYEGGDLKGVEVSGELFFDRSDIQEYKTKLGGAIPLTFGSDDMDELIYYYLEYYDDPYYTDY